MGGVCKINRPLMAFPSLLHVGGKAALATERAPALQKRKGSFVTEGGTETQVGKEKGAVGPVSECE